MQECWQKKTYIIIKDLWYSSLEMHLQDNEDLYYLKSFSLLNFIQKKINLEEEFISEYNCNKNKSNIKRLNMNKKILEKILPKNIESKSMLSNLCSYTWQSMKTLF